MAAAARLWRSPPVFAIKFMGFRNLQLRKAERQILITAGAILPL